MKVYLSRSTRDRDLAYRVVEELQGIGIEVLSERGISPGDNWLEAIGRIIDQADAVLVLWTEAAITSSFVVREATLAAEQNKYFGVVAGNVELPLQFRRLHHVQVGESDFENLAALGAQLSRFEELGAAPRASNRTRKEAAKRRPPPSPIAPEQRRAAPDVEAPPELEIPAFLRRQPEEGVTGLAEAPVAQAPTGVAPDPFAAPLPGAAGQTDHYDVFISYSSRDKEACKLAFNLMVERGLVPWYDKDIGSGAFKSKIVTRISNSSVFVLLLSKNSTGSSNVSKELSIASSKDRLIIPISIDGTRPDDLTDTFRYELIELNIFKAHPEQPESWSEVMATIAESVSEVRAEAALSAPAGAPAPVTAGLPLLATVSPALSPQKLRRPVLLGFLTLLSGLLQQGAVGYGLWRSGVAGPELALAGAVAAGVVIWPACFATAWLARLALRPAPR